MCSGLECCELHELLGVVLRWLNAFGFGLLPLGLNSLLL